MTTDTDFDIFTAVRRAPGAKPVSETLGWDEFDKHTVARLFGFMLERALPVVKHHRADLFYDAEWITKYVEGKTVFYYQVRDTGTFCGLDPVWLVYADDATCTTYEVSVSRTEKRQWVACFTQVVLD